MELLTVTKDFPHTDGNHYSKIFTHFAMVTTIRVLLSLVANLIALFSPNCILIFIFIL